jgi:hypothetical protein
VVTVRCGRGLGSGFALPVDDPPPGYRTAIITNHHVIDACAYTDGPNGLGQSRR